MQVKRVPSEQKEHCIVFSWSKTLALSPSRLQSSALLQNLQVIVPLFVCQTRSTILASPWQRNCTVGVNRTAA